MTSKRNRAKHTATLAERLGELGRKVRADMENLPPGASRDALIQKIREIDAAIFFNQKLGTSSPPQE
jgi:hypothetical protein